MTIKHHPSDETIAAYMGGALDEPSRLVVASHLRLCGHCRATARMLQTAGGVLLEESQPVPLADGALQAVLSRLDADDSEIPVNGVETSNDPDLPASLAPLLQGLPLGKWRSLGIGLKMRTIETGGPSDLRLFMLKAEPGIKLPHHSHTGREWTCVLQGAFRHEHGRFGAGDFDEADDTVEHHPVVEEGERCICIVAMQGRIELQGWLGRLLQPLVRF
ncbi:Anti-sigma-E factor ChrR [Methyloligella halotolerans]|uniref:Anti-sigma-E factor ChrR n=1 Tax=Methyloligella halotolerans TaxID=1177755 RepID=A0A1E2RWU6_9HYPH|nr:ChrR family anti-sigma-E factor [Methyloligella halotolerans]ODA66704.1 Anti-sigma-E factor ChrR [Methyloligella halotolerans]